jgi:protein TonB
MVLPLLLAILAPQPPVTMSNSPPPAMAGAPYPPGAIPYPAAPPMPPPPPAAVVREPQARAPLQQLISAADYPPSALAQGEQGRVEFTLDIAANGRVEGCTITRSSGSAALDSATCRLLRSRARFTPAVTSTGMPAAASIDDAVRWDLP